MIEHIPIERSELHPLYNRETRRFDFWMIKLKWATQLHKDKFLDKLHRNLNGVDFVLNSTPNIELTTMGFGTLEQGGITPNILQHVTLKYITNDACTHDPYQYSNDEILDSMLCAFATDKDTCQASDLSTQRYTVRCFTMRLTIYIIAPYFQ